MQDIDIKTANTVRLDIETKILPNVMITHDVAIRPGVDWIIQNNLPPRPFLKSSKIDNFNVLDDFDDYFRCHLNQLKQLNNQYTEAIGMCICNLLNIACVICNLLNIACVVS